VVVRTNAKLTVVVAADGPKFFVGGDKETETAVGGNGSVMSTVNYRHCKRSEAIHTFFLDCFICFVPRSFAMTIRYICIDTTLVSKIALLFDITTENTNFAHKYSLK